jgi:hypothetical protein
MVGMMGQAMIKKFMEGMTMSNPDYERQLEEQEAKMQLMEKRMEQLMAQPILAFDEQRIREVVCQTFSDNKRSLLKRGST